MECRDEIFHAKHLDLFASQCQKRLGEPRDGLFGQSSTHE